MPFEKIETVKDTGGQDVQMTIFNFQGFTKVTAAQRPSTSGAQFPMVGWEAVPGAEMLAKIRTAYSYSFYIRLNSSRTVVTPSTNTWSFLTAVVTDFAPEQGFEYSHYFGSKDGDALNNNLTTIAYGAWRKITVVLDKSDTANFNLDQPGWLTVYTPKDDPRGPFNQNMAQKIQWQIPLQHNDGAQRNGDPYDRVTGEFHFDFDFYGLELQMTK
jgi:hypothetical protein